MLIILFQFVFTCNKYNNDVHNEDDVVRNSCRNNILSPYLSL